MKMFSRLKSLIYNTCRVWGTYLIPKKKNFYVFRPTQNTALFSGNTKALYLYINQRHPEIKTRLISDHSKVIKDAKKFGLQTVKTKIKVLWAYVRAEHIIVDCFSQSKPFSRCNVSIIQLWHGVGFKKTALLDENFSLKKREWYSEIFKKYNLFLTTATLDKKRQNEAFGISTAKITGYPRNDIFFRDDRASYVNRLKHNYEIHDYARVISYVPTFRDIQTSSAFSENFWAKLQTFLELQNAVFLIKKHPREKLLHVPKDYANIMDFSDKITDVQDLNLITDILITDYSSISTDFVLTDKPILIYAYDYVEYQEKCQDFYYDLKEILPQPFIDDENELLNALKKEWWTDDGVYKESYRKFKDTFHYYKDGHSCERAFNEIHKISK